MSEEKPLSQEEIERYMSEMPKHILGRLPNNIERRRAEQLVDQAYDYARQSREKKADS